MTTTEELLFIEPLSPPSAVPLIDELTIKMVFALRAAPHGSRLSGGQFITGSAYRGWHRCSCGAYSSSFDYLLPDGIVTNSLAAHYLAWHRDEVPVDQLEAVRHMPKPEVTPTTPELAPPPGR